VPPLAPIVLLQRFMPNRLSLEKSPYLLQHAENPVDWFAWGDEAFAKAKAENLPIFLSVGYSTCHWCHVMERESFEDEGVAAFLNEHFVPIKVDREERPDVDRLYMTFVQMATGQGGWPMSVWLSPEGQPFFGGTYFPPVDAYGRPGFPTVLNSLARAWREDEDNVRQSAGSSLGAIERYAAVENTQTEEGNWQAIIEACFGSLRAQYDEEWGGFGGPPKFPRPVQHDFLHLFALQMGSDEAREMSFHTLRMMNERGMNDQLGGGFHRYSVDGFWIVSHFEKMLYDQAQLAISNLEAWQMSGENTYREAAESTLRYVWRDLTHLDGGFFAAEDADSAPSFNATHKDEGAFYVWTEREIDAVLGEDSRAWKDFYGVQSKGNAPKEGDPHGEFRGKNILFQAEELPTVAKMNGLNGRELNEKLALSKEKLFEARAKRPRPHRDDKIIAAWNGLMISAFARTGTHAGNTKWTRAARIAFDFVWRELWDGENLFRHFKDGRADVLAFADDYAALARAALDLYDATFQTVYLEKAQTLADRMRTLFFDETSGGFWNSGLDPRVPVRFKEDYDGAEPSASSLAVEVGARLFHLLGRDDWREVSVATANAFTSRLDAIPSSMPLLLRNQMLLQTTPQHIVIVGEKESASELLSATREGFAPSRFVVLLDEASRPFWEARQEFLRGMKRIDEQPTAFVCQNFACQSPTTSAIEVRRLLG